ncbi:hypothetical protein CYMTET_48502 [Cymbomonas tetramitiformis]|uniref:Reverse transcriptase RNase H-like domain-containing protein n=1 Tax=Cymbomonas tetramitiformis TaxID=36881 RepID=A0AAE0BTW1_9CHLO|nr:hypothetical protein CYMTET_48502 [Cymbomonas tetramitiformis]
MYVLDVYNVFLRESAVIWHAHLRKCPSVAIDDLVDPRKEDWLHEKPKQAKNLFTEEVVEEEPVQTPNNDSLAKKADVTGALNALNVDGGPLADMNRALPLPVEGEDYRELFQMQDGKVLTRPPKQYTREEFCDRLLAFAHSFAGSQDAHDETAREEPCRGSQEVESGHRLTTRAGDTSTLETTCGDVSGVWCPFPSRWHGRHIHGVGVVDKDHSNFEKVCVVHNFSENEEASVNVATDIPEQKWQSVCDALTFLRPMYYMIKVDIKGAYRHLPIALQYLPFHTYKWGELVADLRFPFETESGPHGALEGLAPLQDVLEFLGLEVAYEKCEGPAGQRVVTLLWFGTRSVFWALSLWGHLLYGLTVVLITDNTPTKGMLEKWKCTPDFRLLLRRIFKECVEFDIRLVVEWVPSKENQFSDALRRKEMQLFFDLHKKWKAESLWRKDRDDWKLFAEVFEK